MNAASTHPFALAGAQLKHPLRGLRSFRFVARHVHCPEYRNHTALALRMYKRIHRRSGSDNVVACSRPHAHAIRIAAAPATNAAAAAAHSSFWINNPTVYSNVQPYNPPCRIAQTRACLLLSSDIYRFTPSMRRRTTTTMPRRKRKTADVQKMLCNICTLSMCGHIILYTVFML